MDTTFGVLSFENVLFDPDLFETYVIESVLSKENLSFIFQTPANDSCSYKKMLKRFVPSSRPENLQAYIEDFCKDHHAFYSFLAEALLPIAYRDVYDFKLILACIAINQTLVDQDTGADACMVDFSKKQFVLGEAKFYQSYREGMTCVANNFIKSNGFYNKLDSLKRAVDNNDATHKIVIRELGKTETTEFSLEEFLELNISFSGFVLHEASCPIEKYLDSHFLYDEIDLSVKKIEDNIQDVCPLPKNGKYTVTLFHLPIQNKQKLIEHLMATVYEVLGDAC